MPILSKKRWTAFVEPSHVNEACELDEGNSGPRVAVPTTEYPRDYRQYPKLERDCAQYFASLANPAIYELALSMRLWTTVPSAS